MVFLGALWGIAIYLIQAGVGVRIGSQRAFLEQILMPHHILCFEDEVPPWVAHSVCMYFGFDFRRTNASGWGAGETRRVAGRTTRAREPLYARARKLWLLDLYRCALGSFPMRRGAYGRRGGWVCTARCWCQEPSPTFSSFVTKKKRWVGIFY